ncbi:hypothetical protein AVEN_29311-1 [Araneus ventricosus]|uniref:Uncharacterized protein n=1 Tax=Araneus ventricosus TaxID=182803 RepID=A0A4Y2MLA9_ARAVE|nr:hypothetical protein AVEN_207139-1 [Araneus ventricosus]GBN27349.1 hypothetical protein AVEN_29311-1 [Araneus ventricosus]
MAAPKNHINSIYYYIQQMAALQLPNSKSMTHFIAQRLQVPTHTQMGGNSLPIWTQNNYRFLDIQIISNKLGDAPVVHRALSYSVLFISQYPPPDRENSFCLEVSILDSGPIGLQLQSTYCHSGDPDVCVLALYRSDRSIWSYEIRPKHSLEGGNVYLGALFKFLIRILNN